MALAPGQHILVPIPANLYGTCNSGTGGTAFTIAAVAKPPIISIWAWAVFMTEI